MKSFWKEIKNEKRPVVIYGTGDAAEKLFNMLKKRGIRTMAFSSSSTFLRDRSFLSYKVLSLERVEEIFGDDIVLLLAFGSHDKAVIDHIVSLSREYDLFMPDLLRDEEDEAVTDETLRKESKRIEWAYSLLSDSFSRDVFSSTLEYRMTGRIEPLLKVGREEEENWDLLELKKEDIFLDGGAYNGDTVSLFIQKSGGYNEIYAFEPSSLSFRRLNEKYGGKEGINLINAALGEKDGEVSFSLGHGRGNKVEKGGGTRVRSIDSILEGRRVDVIKLDIEGEEENALEGAKETIKKYRPRILLSCYHKNDDYWRLLEKVWEIRDDYKVYMRKNISLPNWDTYYVLK